MDPFSKLLEKCASSIGVHSRSLSALRRVRTFNRVSASLAATPSYVGQVPVHRGVQTKRFRIGEGGTHDRFQKK